MNKDICQFYVVVGDSSFVPPVDNNVYINVTNVTDYKVIQDEIFRMYKEKAKLGISVGSEIIFLVGGISDSDKAHDIINKLRLNGKIQVIKRVDNSKPIEREETKEEEKKEVLEKLGISKEKVDKLNDLDEKLDYKNENNINNEEIKEDSSKMPDNVYRRDFENTSYSGYIGKPIGKKDKVNKLPLIIFIISLLLFICSVVLLFVL